MQPSKSYAPTLPPTTIGDSWNDWTESKPPSRPRRRSMIRLHHHRLPRPQYHRHRHDPPILPPIPRPTLPQNRPDAAPGGETGSIPLRSNMFGKLTPYAKALLAAIMAGLTVASTYWPSQHWVTILIAVFTVLGVYLIPNTPSGGGK